MRPIKNACKPSRFAYRDGEDGAVAVIVIIGLVVFFGLGALVVDLGLLRAERSDAQLVADNAALAAAWADCNDTGDPVAVGEGVATRNGTTAVVTSLGSGQWKAVVGGQIDTAFAPAVSGQDTMDTEAQAVAECTTGPGGPYAIFAGSRTCSNPAGAEWSGSVTAILGNVHANTVVQVQSDTVIKGDITWKDGYKSGNGLTVTLDPPDDNPRETDYKPYPYTYDIDDFKLGGAAATAAGTDYYQIPPGPGGKYKLDITPLTPPGLYYAPGDLTVTSTIDVGPAVDITVVAVGRISGNNLYKQMTPYHDDLLFFSWHEPPASCNNTAIKLSGSDIGWSGLLYAPNGGIDLSSSGISTLQGSLVGYTVNVSGSSFTLDASQGPPAAVPFAALVE